MLRTNLSTKPFYNERGVHALLAIIALVVLALTAVNVAQVVLLTRRQSQAVARASAAEARASQLRAHATSIRRSLDPTRLEATSAAAREANTLIDQRLFSWTDLLGRLETSLPDDVRITALRPNLDARGGGTVVMTVVGRRVQDIDQFMQNLQGTGAFSNVFPREETQTEDGLRQASIEGRYVAQ